MQEKTLKLKELTMTQLLTFRSIDPKVYRTKRNSSGYSLVDKKGIEFFRQLKAQIIRSNNKESK